MSESYVITRSWKPANGSSVSYETTITSDTSVDHSGEYADGETDKVINISIDYSQVKALFIGSDQDVLLETNNPGGSSGSADQEFELKANCPIIWTEDDIETNPITADITVIYLTNASGSAANVEIHALYDATP